jgi:hypothetical protein
MRNLFGLISVSFVLASCATNQASEVAATPTTCREIVNSLGTAILKRQQCSQIADAESEEAQKTARELRDEQIRNKTPPSKGGN